MTLALAAPLAARAEDAAPSEAAIRAAVSKSLPLLVRGAKGSLELRKQCFTCHNQGLPVMALVAARERGFEIDAEHLQTQLKFTADFLEKNHARYLEGRGQGGQADTAGYALWMLDVGGWQADGTTVAVAEYLLQYQAEQDYWEPTSHRPPGEHSRFTSSYVALRGLKKFQSADHEPRVKSRFDQLRAWALRTKAEDTEDRVFRLRSLALLDAPADDVRRAAQELLDTQRNDGGWAQTAEMTSDAYATGTALAALHEAGGLAVDAPQYCRGLAYLIAAQEEDGSWHVKSRAKPFQAYFESGYPHGKDQFLSIAAAGWATLALVESLPAQ